MTEAQLAKIIASHLREGDADVEERLSRHGAEYLLVTIEGEEFTVVIQKES